jgi:polysaccharide biosynthesis transport protein
MSLQQALAMLMARKCLMLVTLAATVAAAGLITFMLPHRYTATASIVIDFKTLDPVSGNLLPVALLPGYLATQLDIIASHNVALKAVDTLKLGESPEARQAFQEKTGGKGSLHDWLADLLLKEVKLNPSRESSLVNINFRSNDPDFAAAVANAFVQGYITTNLELKVEPARQSTSFFNEQLKGLKENLTTAQRKLSAFQREKGITAIDERFDVENARLAELSTQVVGAQAQTFDSASRRRQASEAIARGGSADSMAEVLTNPVVQSLKTALAQAEGRFKEVSGRVGPVHPQYQAAQGEVEDLKRMLAEEMSVVARSLGTSTSIAAQREGSLKGALAMQRARVLAIKEQRDESALLMREVENAQRAYDLVMARSAQTRLESQSNQTNIAVINPAIPPTQPSSPRLLLNLALATMAGIALAVGLALIVEMSDRVVRCEQDVFDALDAPVLGLLEAPRREFPPLPALGARRPRAITGPGMAT